LLKAAQTGLFWHDLMLRGSSMKAAGTAEIKA